ncbi:hypothetical protein M4914_08190 [Streptomyces somaliensis DSM 40738]|uniref:Uncharacterized protein n=1 Tax=Streptomyces somaliensis (strain ATCC 33201 / DSM 40738 / JCM 12659 / KCTC 9044 / NCTC 11332 / NRRL B-12077 / IP 733) TaxID=1134445 RepID=A0AA44DDZ8_STRE0|nr:hypothetical protein [Streptomyces somaliensis]MCQ0022934.1 hypothetical protein [Streptomyces somaliensis DSM 40738]NKY15196.1 hypothetical protein [Streptomyces somaliensis DSM 40738]
MTYDRLVCASCAAPVSEGRCPVCRANRERMQQNSWSALSPSALLALFLLLAAMAAALVVAHQPA